MEDFRLPVLMGCRARKRKVQKGETGGGAVFLDRALSIRIWSCIGSYAVAQTAPRNAVIIMASNIEDIPMLRQQLLAASTVLIGGLPGEMARLLLAPIAIQRCPVLPVAA